MRLTVETRVLTYTIFFIFIYFIFHLFHDFLTTEDVVVRLNTGLIFT